MLRHFFHAGRTYFELDHRQARTYLWLLLFTAVVVCSPLFTYYWYPVPSGTGDVQVIFQQTLARDSLQQLASSSAQIIPSFHKRIDEMQQEDWVKAGLPVYLAKRIVKYHHKIKPLKEVAQLYTIYGLDSAWVSKLTPYLKEVSVPVYPPHQKKKEKKSLTVLDINTADSTALEALPAIGPVLSKRILKYRELLKGYVHKEQYTEIYGINAEALAILQKWTEIKSIPVVCELKAADYLQLSAHFYLSGKDAKYIVTQLKTQVLCWDELKSGLEPKAQEHLKALQLYYPCD